MGRDNEMSPEDAGMCPHGNFPDSCEQCKTEGSSESEQLVPEGYELPNQNDPAVKEQQVDDRRKHFKKDKAERVGQSKEVRERQIVEIDAEIQKLEDRLEDRRRLREQFEQEIREGDDFVARL